MATARKIVLGKAPTSVKRVITAPMLDGKEGAIECEFKYRNKVQFGELIDRMFAAATTETETEPEAAAPTLPPTYGQILVAGVEKNAAYLGEILLGWNLDVELSPEALHELCVEHPAMAQAVMDAYRTACTEGRWGN